MRNVIRPSLRWAVPATVAAALVVAGSGALSSGSSGPRTSSPDGVRLVAAVRSTAVPALSGTVQITTAIPGLPTPPAVRLWLAGTGRARLEVDAPSGRLAAYRSGGRTWVWDAATRTATRIAGRTPPAADPVRSARTLLARVAHDSTVTVGAEVTVAGRPARTLVVRPTDPGTLVGSLRLAIDTRTRLPLALEVWPRGGNGPAVKVAFTRLHLGTPPAGTFRFTPPPGARVRTAPDAPGVSGASAAPLPVLVGRGWSTVMSLRLPAGAASSGAVRALPAVHGAWGSGRLARTPLGSALITDDGRLLAGAVGPQALYAAAR